MDLLSQIPSALGLFGTGLSQHARLLTLASAQDSGLPESLMAESFSGRESVNELYPRSFYTFEAKLTGDL